MPGQIDYGLGGIYYNYFRDYDSNTGRYLESDPVGIFGGLNTYAYANGNPTHFTDPLGLFSPQKKGCDIWPDGNECTLKCCDEHDRCYEANRCNMYSWLYTGGIVARIFN